MPSRDPYEPRQERPLSRPEQFGKYELLERIGVGGMAEVWKARSHGPAGFSRTVVIKRILPHLAEDSAFVDMFIVEAQLSAKLHHPNIIQVYELGEVELDYYIAMEYVRGRDLRKFSRAHLKKQGVPTPALSAYVMREVCHALSYAHDYRDEDGTPLKVIHRDVSPSNVMLGYDGTVKLLDFGIAKALVGGGHFTQTGTLKGKFSYMAPEQVEGSDIDHRADIFAAGVLLHELLTGQRLFRGANDLQTIALVKEADVAPPSVVNPNVPLYLDRVTLKALARNRAERYGSALEMAADLDEIVHHLKGGPVLVTREMNELFGDEPVTGRVSKLPPGAPGLRALVEQTLPLIANQTVAAAASRSTHDLPTVVRSAPSLPSLADDDELRAPQTLPLQLPIPAPASVETLLRPRRWPLVLAGVVAGLAILGIAALVSQPKPAPLELAPSAEPVARPPQPRTTSLAAKATTTTPAVPLTPTPTPTPTHESLPSPPPVSVAAPRPARSPPHVVHVSVTSVPSGAEVILDGESRPRGRTPVTFELNRDKTRHSVRLLLRGHELERQSFSTTSDLQLQVVLQRARPISRPARPTSPPSDDGDLVDPFPSHR